MSGGVNARSVSVNGISAGVGPRGCASPNGRAFPALVVARGHARVGARVKDTGG